MGFSFRYHLDGTVEADMEYQRPGGLRSGAFCAVARRISQQ